MGPYLRLLAVSAVITVGAHASLAEVVQLPLTYNVDVVREPGGTITPGGIDPATNAGPGGRGFVTQAEAAANDPVDPHGLPDNGVLAVPGGTVQLGPYNGNNALLLTSAGGSFGISGDQLAGFDTLQIYGAGQGAVMGTPSGASLQAFFDTASENGFSYGGFSWDNPTPPGGGVTYALSGLDRTGPGGAGFEDVDGINLVRWSIIIPRAAPLNFINFTVNPNTGGVPTDQRIAILAVTATSVPEPSAAALCLATGLGLLARRRR